MKNILCITIFALSNCFAGDIKTPAHPHTLESLEACMVVQKDRLDILHPEKGTRTDYCVYNVCDQDCCMEVRKQFTQKYYDIKKNHHVFFGEKKL
jgi:hypothetical protein